MTHKLKLNHELLLFQKWEQWVWPIEVWFLSMRRCEAQAWVKDLNKLSRNFIKETKQIQLNSLEQMSNKFACSKYVSAVHRLDNWFKLSCLYPRTVHLISTVSPNNFVTFSPWNLKLEINSLEVWNLPVHCRELEEDLEAYVLSLFWVCFSDGELKWKKKIREARMQFPFSFNCSRTFKWDTS